MKLLIDNFISPFSQKFDGNVLSMVFQNGLSFLEIYSSNLP